MQPAACAKLRALFESGPKIRHFSTPAARHRDGTIDAQSLSEAWNRRKRIVVIGALIQMATVGLILVGAAVVLFGSMFNPRQADPMGMFGLPSVCAIACRLKEREKSGNAPDRNSVAACKPRGGVDASGFTVASTRG